MRLHNGLACALLGLAGLWHGGAAMEAAQVAGLVLVILLLAAAAHLANDIVDLTADRANRPSRPLPSRRLSLPAARRAFLASLAGGVLLGVLTLPRWWPWYLLWAAAGPGYSLLAKGRGWRGPLWTAGVIASCYLPGAVLDGLGVVDVALFFIVFYFVFFREYVKGLEDAPGDVFAGYRSLAGGRDLGRRVVLLALPLVTVTVLAVVREPLVSWGRIAGAGFLLCLAAALLILPAGRRRGRHLAGSLLKLGAFCGLGLLWGLLA
jgi:4-hydroxybenzoate polyprenyltransferase